MPTCTEKVIRAWCLRMADASQRRAGNQIADRSTTLTVDQGRAHDCKNWLVVGSNLVDRVPPVLSSILSKFRGEEGYKFFVAVSHSLTPLQGSTGHDHSDEILGSIQPNGFVSPDDSADAVSFKRNGRAFKID